MALWLISQVGKCRLHEPQIMRAKMIENAVYGCLDRAAALSVHCRASSFHQEVASAHAMRLGVLVDARQHQAWYRNVDLLGGTEALLDRYIYDRPDPACVLWVCLMRGQRVRSRNERRPQSRSQHPDCIAWVFADKAWAPCIPLTVGSHANWVFTPRHFLPLLSLLTVLVC